MNAHVVTVQFQPGKIDEAIGIYRDIAPVVKQQQGFKGALVLTDPNTGKGVSITLWETEADLLKVTVPGGVFQEQLAKFAQVLAGPPTIESYEVSVRV
jgi:heme-degrading monooxygenase HmoA